MNFCSACGAAEMKWEQPDGDQHHRWVCAACNSVFYDNPRVIAGCVIGHEGRVLLVKRAIEPRRGTWTLPAGFMENGETLEEAAAREVFEETGAPVSIQCLYSVFSIPHINQIYVIFQADMISPTLRTSPESEEVRLFAPEELPWDNLSYPAIGSVLQRFVSEMLTSSYSLYVGSFEQGRVFFASGQQRGT